MEQFREEYDRELPLKHDELTILPLFRLYQRNNMQTTQDQMVEHLASCFDTIRQNMENKKPKMEAVYKASIWQEIDRIKKNMRATFCKALMEKCKSPSR